MTKPDQDISRWRAETPGCATRIHLNNAGAALMPAPVLQAVQDYLQMEGAIGGYEASDACAADLAGFYTAVARLLHTQPRNVAFCTSATDAYARALSAIPWRSDDVILTTDNDYVSNQIAFLALKKRFGIKLLRAKESPAGGADMDDMAYLIRQHAPKLVAVTQVPTSSGLVQPVEAVGRLCREHGIWYLVDACQSAGQLQLDVQRIGCDFLSATTRKFLRGPRGAGFLYVSDRVLEEGLEMLLPDMRSGHWEAADQYRPAEDAHRFEYWENAPALVLGSKVAVEYALDIGLDRIESRVRHLAEKTRHLLADLPGVQVLDRGADLCGIVTAFHPKWAEQPLLEFLRARGINARTSPNYVARLDFARKGVEWALRLSPHYYNTESEIESAIAALSEFKI